MIGCIRYLSALPIATFIVLQTIHLEKKPLHQYIYISLSLYIYIHVYLYIYICIYHTRTNDIVGEKTRTTKNRLLGPAATVSETLGDGLSHRFSHTPSFIQAGAEDARVAPRIADLTARCTESSDFRVSLAPIVALQALYLLHATPRHAVIAADKK